MTYALLKTLIDHAERFEQENQGVGKSFAHFLGWLNQQEAGGTPAPPMPNAPEGTPPHTLDSLIGMLLILLYRYGRSYLKKGSDDLSPEEFAYLAPLMGQGSLTKAELIDLNLHEKTTGMDIIRRLLEKGLVRQFENPDDRRSKKLEMTEKGQRMFIENAEQTGKACEIITGNLTQAEKHQLLYLLQKLQGFHQNLYSETREKSLDDTWARAKETR